MAKTKSAMYISIRALAFGIGAAFPFVSVLWKIIILMVFLFFRVIDIERDGMIFSVTSLFFIGMIIAFTYKLFS